MLLGYCAYYVAECTVNPLPVTQEAADLAFQNLQVSKDGSIVTVIIIHCTTQDGYWPVFTHFLGILTVCLLLSRGVSTIEPANRIIVPLLLILLTFTFYWAIFLPSASEGIIHMFSPNWGEYK